MSDLLSPAAAGALMGVGADRIAQLVRDGTLNATRTPGGHIRIDRVEVERVVADRAGNPTGPAPDDETDDMSRESATMDGDSPRRQNWEDVPPWKRRVREAQADVEVLSLDDQKEKLRAARADREAARERAESERERRDEEAKRLKQLKAHAMAWYVGFDVPSNVRAHVAREIEQAVTSARYPSGLTLEHAHALLKADVDGFLADWRKQRDAEVRAKQEPLIRETTILAGVVHGMKQMPDEWDAETRKAFEHECRRAVTREYTVGMDQDDAKAIADEVLDRWLGDYSSDRESVEQDERDDDAFDDEEEEEEEEEEDDDDTYDDENEDGDFEDGEDDEDDEDDERW